MRRIGILALAMVLAGALAWGGRSEVHAYTAWTQSAAVWSTGAHCPNGSAHQTTINFQLSDGTTYYADGSLWRQYRLQMWPSDGCTYANWHPWISKWVCGTFYGSDGWYWPNSAWSDNMTILLYYGTATSSCGPQADDVDRNAQDPWYGWISYAEGGDLFNGVNAYICLDPTHPGCAGS